MSHAEEKPVILSIGDDGGMRQAAWHDPAFREAGWQHWTVEEGLRSPAAERGPDEDVRIRVRSVRRGTAVERALLQALRTGAGWVGAWFPAAGPAPSLQELEQLGFAALQADLARVRENPPGSARNLGQPAGSTALLLVSHESGLT